MMVCVNCGSNLIWLIAKGYSQNVSDVSVDASEVNIETDDKLNSRSAMKTVFSLSEL
jgi:hypothetical protein